MGWNGSGGFDRLEDFTDDLAAGPPNDIVSAAKVDNEFDNIKAGLQNCLTRDGQNSPSANISWGTYKLTNLGTPTSSADAATKAYVDGVSYLGAGISALSSGTVDALDLIAISDVSDSNNPKKVTAQSIANLASTSITLTMPTEFSVSGSPVSSTGTLAVSKANQNANLVYAGPSSGGAAAPTFRALAAADLGTGTANATTYLAGDMTFKNTIILGQTVAVVTSQVTCTTALPIDDTVPQVTEGTQWATVTYTPRSASSTLLVRAVCGTFSNSGVDRAQAIFRDGASSAIGASVTGVGLANVNAQVQTYVSVSSGSTAATTFTARVGTGGGQTIYINGNGTRYFGGVYNSYIEVIEVS